MQADSSCSPSLMDKTSVCGTDAPGSIPGGSTECKGAFGRFLHSVLNLPKSYDRIPMLLNSTNDHLRSHTSHKLFPTLVDW